MLYSTLLDQLMGGIDKEKGWMYFQQIVEGVYYMHHKDIIHRDLSTQNILIDEDSNIKISDFGLGMFYIQWRRLFENLVLWCNYYQYYYCYYFVLIRFLLNSLCS